jgi:hypothetical protein
LPNFFFGLHFRGYTILPDLTFSQLWCGDICGKRDTDAKKMLAKGCNKSFK